MSITAASASEQAQLDEAAALARATVDAANLNSKEKARVGDAARQAAPPPGCIRECGVTYGVRQLYDGSVAAGGGGASTASVAGFSLFSHGGFPPGRGTYRNAPTYAEAAVALELSESIEKLLLDDFDDEC